MEFILKPASILSKLSVVPLLIAMLSGIAHTQAVTIGVSGAAGDKFREAMNQQDPKEKLRLLREAEPLFSDPVSKYSVLYPSLVDAYIGVDDLPRSADALEQMAKAGVPEITESDARLHLATAFMSKEQYESAVQQSGSAVAGLKKSAEAKSAPLNKVQQSLIAALALEGEALLGMGNAQKALEALRESEELRKTRHLDPSANTARNIARAYAKLGKMDDALESFAEAYSLAAHRVNAIERHMEVAGQAASAGFMQELVEQKQLLAKIKDEVGPVYGSRETQTPLKAFLDQKLDAFDQALTAAAMIQAKTDKPAPGFNLNSVAGSKTKLDELRGKVVLLNFWDTTCKPCRAEYPHLQKIQDEFKDKGLSVLMINLDEDKTRVKPFAEKYGFTARVLLKDANIQNAYGVGAIPHTVIIDGSGVIRFNEVGFTLDTPEVFRAEIRSLLPKAQ
jgi:peroxiredoxin